MELSHCMLRTFWHAVLSQADFFKIKIKKYIFLQYHQGVKQFGSRSDPYILSGLIWVQPVCNDISADGTSRLRVKTPEKSVITKCEIFVKNADRGTADADVVSMSFAG